MVRLKGIDCSKWQGIIDFASLKTAVDFVIIRSSYGNGYTDAQFTRNRDECRKLGILLGYYHYSYPQYNSPEEEADWFVKVVGTPNNGELLCLDFEESWSDPVGWSLAFLNRVSERLSGYKPLLYINKSLANGYDWKPVVDRNYGLWLAYWDYNIDGAVPSTPWPTTAMRQWSNREVFPGIAGGVDADVFYGDWNTYLAYGYKSVNPPISVIEQLPKDSIIKDVYNSLTGSYPSDDTLKWRLEQGKNIQELITDICQNDSDFYNLWVKPHITVEPLPEPEPVPHDTCPERSIVTQIHDVLYGMGFWWIKYFRIKELVPR